MNEHDYRKYFLRTLIAALSVSALIGIFIFLAGDFGETETKLLLTTLTIGGYSLTGLCSSTIYEHEHLKGWSALGMIISILGFLIAIAAIWEVANFEDLWKPMTTFIILAVSMGHISLLLLVRPKTDNIKYILYATIIFIAIVALMLIQTTLNEFNNSEFFYRLLGVAAILDILGTISTPIINKIAD